MFFGNGFIGQNKEKVPVPPLAIPSSPAVITESGVTKTEIKLDWDQVVDAANYNIEVAPTVTGYPKDISVNTLALTGLTSGTEYTINIKACNVSGCSAATEKKVTTAATTTTATGGASTTPVTPKPTPVP